MMQVRTVAVVSFLYLGILMPIFVQARTLAQIVDQTIVPLGNLIISLIYALCFLFFLIGIVRYFLSPSEEARQNGRQFAIWGIIAFAVLFSTWGLVRVLIGILTEFNT